MKLYWRIKIDGKWTWRPASLVESLTNEKFATARVPAHPDVGPVVSGPEPQPEPLE